VSAPSPSPVSCIKSLRFTCLGLSVDEIITCRYSSCDIFNRQSQNKPIFLFFPTIGQKTMCIHTIAYFY
jgi:hypothetical protein